MTETERVNKLERILKGDTPQRLYWNRMKKRWEVHDGAGVLYTFELFRNALDSCDA